MAKAFSKNKDPTTLPMRSEELIINSLRGNDSLKNNFKRSKTMSKTFSKNKKLNKTIKDINEMKNKELVIAMNEDNSSCLLVFHSNDLVEYSLANKTFLNNIDGNSNKLLDIKNSYYNFFRYWTAFYNNDYKTLKKLNYSLGDDELNTLKKAKNGDKNYLSFITNLISAYYLLCIYFDKKILDNINDSEGFILIIS